MTTLPQPQETVLDPNWRDRGLCRPDRLQAWRPGARAEWLLVDQPRSSPLTLDNVVARAICQRHCPVREDCLAAAVLNHDFGQIRGGVVLRMPHEWATCKCGQRFLRGHKTNKEQRQTCSDACRSELISNSQRARQERRRQRIVQRAMAVA